MPRTGENIYKRKDGRWEGRYLKSKDAAGKSRYGYVYGKTYREVKEKRITAMTQMTEDNLPTDIKTEDKFGEIAMCWLSATEAQVKESSSVKYRSLLEKHILPAFQDCSLCDLSNEKIQTFSTELLTGGGKQGRGLSGKTVSDILSVLRSILSFAVLQGKTVPADGSNVRIKRKQKPLRVLSQEEQRTLCKELLGNAERKNVGILLCLFTGIRIGELCALRWEDFSLPDHTVHVHQTMQRIQSRDDNKAKTKVIITETKSPSSNRVIPLPQNIMMILNDIPDKQGYFLTGTEQQTEPRVMQNHFKRALQKCGVDHANFHTLRHTFATRCIELDFDPKSLSEILGHSNVTITLNRYVHPTMDLKRDHMERLSDLFSVK